MANAFRSAFFVSSVLTLITIPAVFVGFFPITLFMAMITLVCLIIWIAMSRLYGKAGTEEGTRAKIVPADNSQSVSGDVIKPEKY